MSSQRQIITFSHKGNLIFQVSQTIIDRCSREHQDASLDSILNNALHQAVIPSFPIFMCRLVAKVMRLIDNH